MVLSTRRKSEPAQQHFDSFLQIADRMDRTLETAIYFDQMAEFLMNESKFSEALQASKKAVELFETTDSSQLYLAASLSNLAACQHTNGDAKGAEESARRALEIFVARLGRDHEYTRNTLANLSKIVESNGGAEAVAKLKDSWTKQCLEEEKSIEEAAKKSFSQQHLQQLEQMWKNWVFKKMELRGMIVPHNIAEAEKRLFDAYRKQTQMAEKGATK
jgi:tetratricopeptide (TPR) repeat protein